MQSQKAVSAYFTSRQIYLMALQSTIVVITVIMKILANKAVWPPETIVTARQNRWAMTKRRRNAGKGDIEKGIIIGRIVYCGLRVFHPLN